MEISITFTPYEGDKDMVRIFEKARDRLDKMQDVLGDLHESLGDAPHPLECPMRGSAQPGLAHAHRRP